VTIVRSFVTGLIVSKRNICGREVVGLGGGDIGCGSVGGDMTVEDGFVSEVG